MDDKNFLKNMRVRGPLDRYEWTTHAGWKPKGDAHEIGLHLEKMAEERGGRLRTEEVVQEARKPDSPLYRLIEHDMEVAADKWNHHEAREIMRSLMVVKVVVSTEETTQKSEGGGPDIIVRTTKEETVHARAFPNLMDDGESFYIPVFQVARVPALRSRYLRELLKQMKNWQVRASTFRIFSTVVSAIQEAVEPIEREIQKLEEDETDEVDSVILETLLIQDEELDD